MAGIRSAGVEQAETAAALQDTTRTLGEHADTVDRALLGLGTRSRGAIQALGNMQGVVRRAEDSQQQQAATLAQVLGSVEAIAAASGGHEAPMIALANAVAAVRLQTIEIQGETARFKI